ncbi:MAG: AAA family ATPase [Chitinivibrionales bacterium]|nr:AAA family ATPase [Chitinivibrionales bacterium]
MINIIIGPRQVGKTTAALQIAEKWQGPVITVSADSPLPPGPEWIRNHWERATAQPGTLLIIDEIQKVRGWNETIKSCWDADAYSDTAPQILLLGSSSLLVQKGLSESLAGRFFLYRCSHWSFTEMKDAFSFDCDKWIYYGGYPGTTALMNDDKIWMQYIRDSLIETVISNDVLQMQTIAKPALLRHLFMLSATYPAQIFSYNKMLGQLQDSGNTTTLAHYLSLLQDAYLVSGLEPFKKDVKIKRGGSPKLILWNNALIAAVQGQPYNLVRPNHELWGRLVENAVGAHILNHVSGLSCQVSYWRKDSLEVDFVVETPKAIRAIEVKSSVPQKCPGLRAFCAMYPQARPFIVGPGGMPLEEFFSANPAELFG